MYNIQDIARKSGNELTSEQLNVINSMDNSMLINANPGTGKTTTMVYGIINLILNKNVDPKRILCMSYSRESARAIHLKYSLTLRRALGNSADIIQAPEFSTFHSFCLKQQEVKQVINNDETEKELLESYLVRSKRTLSRKVKYNHLYRLFKYITTFGISDRKDLEKNKDFINLKETEDLDFDTVMTWYDAFFQYKFNTSYFTQGDMPLILLNRLISDSNYAQELNSKYDYVIIDEMQDMNIVYLLTISYIAKKLIAIGDIKQQIYRYNGSDDSIINLFKYAYPKANILELTQSFRCDERIAEYASEIIKYNKYDGFTKFTGKDNGGNVHLIKRHQFYEALRLMSHRFVSKNEWDEYMFLYRYNITGILAAHYLYNYEYAPLYEMEYISTLYSVYMCNKKYVDRFFYAKLNIMNDKLTNAYKRLKTNNTDFLSEIKKEDLTDEEKNVVNTIEKFNTLTNSDTKLVDIYNDFFNNYNVMFRKQETMFKLEEYIELLKEYDNNTFSELVKTEEERKTVKKTKTKFPIHYPKYKQIYTMVLLKELQAIWDLKNNPYNPNNFEYVFNRSKFKVRGKESAVKQYMKEKSCTYTEAVNKCTVSDAERDYLNKLLFIINTMETKNIISYIDGYIAFIQRYYNDAESYLEYYKREINNVIDMIVEMYGSKTWQEMVAAEDEKYQHIQTTISLDYGIKFKTMHASKGLESKRVIILDYEKGSLGNKAELDAYIKNNESYKATETLRDERCLLFVGLTRAIKDVYCVYDTSPTELDTVYYESNKFYYIDSLYVGKLRRNIIIGDKNIRVVVHDNEGNGNIDNNLIFDDKDNSSSIDEMIEFVDTLDVF